MLDARTVVQRETVWVTAEASSTILFHSWVGYNSHFGTAIPVYTNKIDVSLTPITDLPETLMNL